MGLTPESVLKVFEPSAKEYKEIASYAVADNAVYAHPVPAKNGIYVKDQNAVILYGAK